MEKSIPVNAKDIMRDSKYFSKWLILVLSFLVISLLSACATISKKLNDWLNTAKTTTENSNLNTNANGTTIPVQDISSRFILMNDDHQLSSDLYLYCAKKFQPDSLELKWKKCVILQLYVALLSRPNRMNPYMNFSFFYFDSHHLYSVTSNWIQVVQGLLQEWKLSNWFQLEIKDWSRRPPFAILVTKDLHDYLESMKGVLSAQKKIYDYFWRGEELVKVDESLPVADFSKQFLTWWQGISTQVTKSSFDVYSRAIPKLILPSQSWYCNFDLQKYIIGQSSPWKTAINSYSAGSIYNHQQVLWWGSLTSWGQAPLISDRELFPPWMQNYFFNKHTSLVNVASNSTEEKIVPYCLIPKKFELQNSASKTKTQNDEFIILTSLEGRDPGQFLGHWWQYGLESMDNASQLEKLMQFSRHQILNNPLRVALEVERSTPEQLQKILKLGVPVYYADSLGQMSVMYSLNQTQGVILDPRSENKKCCIYEQPLSKNSVEVIHR